MFVDNDWYSHKKILFEYCNVKKLFPIYGTLQHGYFKVSKFNFLKKSFFPKAPYFSFSKQMQKYSIDKNFSIIPIGAPFLYLCKMKKKIEKISKGTGIVLFPAHSNAESYQDVNHEEIIKIIKKKYKRPYKVVLFHTDYYKKNILLYKKHKFKVFCCGKRGDQYFLYKLYRILVNTRNVVCTSVTSALLYAMYLKKNCRIIDVDNQSISLNSNYTVNANSIYKNLFKNNISIEKKFMLAQKELGETHMKSPTELRKILGIENIFLRIISFIISKLQDMKYGICSRKFGLLSFQANDQLYKWVYDKKKNSYFRRKNKDINFMIKANV